MFPFCRKKTLQEAGIFEGMTDWHSHILPGVDDGFKSLEDSLAVLDMYQEAGIREVWLTPHVMEDIPNTTDGLRQRFDELRKAYRGRVILRLAAEYMLDTLFEDRLDRDDLLPIGQEGRHLLVETSCFNPPANLLAILTGIKSRGYYPVLAHPERYVYMGMQDYSLLSDSGVKFQLNLGSLAGMYGSQAAKKAVRLLRNGYYDITGTDLHRPVQLERLTSEHCLDKVSARAVRHMKKTVLEYMFGNSLYEIYDY